MSVLEKTLTTVTLTSTLASRAALVAVEYNIDGGIGCTCNQYDK